MNRRSILLLFTAVLFCCPILVFGQHGVEPPVHHAHESFMFIFLEWVELIVDIVGISILILGFLKGIFVFIKMEIDNITGGDVFDDILALRSTLGGYIILSLDFLIISDIIHSVIKPEFNELINLGIIVILRTSIGFFLGRELMELRHGEKEQQELEAMETPSKH